MDPSRGTSCGVRFVAVLVCFSGFGLALPGCTPGDIVYTYADAGPNPGACTCTLTPPLSEAVWVWMGANPALMPIVSGEVPECPPSTAGKIYDLGADLIAPSPCLPCSCLPSKGLCELPTTFTASTAICGGGGQPLPFDPPASWDGGCDDTAKVSPNLAKSLTIGPLTIKDESCAVRPTSPALERVPTFWKQLARVCFGKGWTQCENQQGICIPNDGQPAGFRLCVIHDGDQDCHNTPTNYWPEKYTFYRDVQDDRKCDTECRCGPPTGSMCTAKATIYQNNDNTCSGPIVEGSIGIASTMAACVDIVPAGQPLGSKSAMHPTYTPGTCNPIDGKSSGSATPDQELTLCCKPAP